jgi:hypothetical protein
MTKKTITTCDLCDKELKLGLFKSKEIWRVEVETSFGIINTHFCTIEHLREYFRDKCEIMDKNNGN